MFKYDIYFWSWDDLDDFELALIRNGLIYEIEGFDCDRLYIFGDWDDAGTAEYLMRIYGIEFYPYW